MSLNLSSLLNPSPDAETQLPSPPSRRDSIPPNPYVLSPRQQFASPPHNGSAHLSYGHSAVTESDAILGKPPSPSWYRSPEYTRDRDSGYEVRPGSSGYDGQIQLPPLSTSGRKMSSPTLEQYQVASRSPDQRRASVMSPPQPSITLPPLQAMEHDFTHQPSHAQEQQDSLAINPLPSVQLNASTSNLSVASDEAASSPAAIKEETVPTPLASSPAATPLRQSASTWDGDAQTARPLAALKHESSVRNNSPLRESSVPVPSTEIAIPESTIPKKRPAPVPSKAKKGMATTVAKKARPAKKRKVEPKRSLTPSSHASRTPAYKNLSGKGTPLNSSPARSTRSQSVDSRDERSANSDGESGDEELEDGDDNDDGDVYCICRKADNGTFMIGCDGTCDDWFHGKCVGIEERNKNLIDRYICPNCTKLGSVGRTTWKRICRRSGCRQPARIGGKSKSGGAAKDASKYCSEECGMLFFRDKIARTRGREDPSRRATARRGSIHHHHHPHLPASTDSDLGARGGLLSAGELKVLVTASKTAEDFKKLGEGVLSPPATPTSTSQLSSFKAAETTSLTPAEKQTLADISTRKDAARRRHTLLKDRMKFVTLVKAAATRAAAKKELKNKEYCGYDSRLEWADAQFAAWRASANGQNAFSREKLEKEDGEEEVDVEMDRTEANTNAEATSLPDYEVCERKKCARHLEWTKLVVDEVRFEMSDNSDRMRGLDREERELRELAALRVKAGGRSAEGVVERHGRVEGVVEKVEVEGQGEAMEVDGLREDAFAAAAAPVEVEVEMAS